MSPPPERSQFPVFRTIATRWMDNDAYGHVNNVQYYSFFDTAVNAALIDAGVLEPASSPVIGLVVETGCRYFQPMAFPDLVSAGLRVDHLGARSVRYALGLFRGEEDEASAAGHFTHVYVDRATRRPVPIPEPVRRVLSGWIGAPAR